MDLVALKQELTNDPLNRGYASMTDAQAADNLNLGDRQPNREELDSGTLVSSIVRSEWATLSAADKDYVRLIALAESVPITATLRSELSDVFPQGTTTRNNLRALLKRTGSRAEELGLGRVTPSDVAAARRLS